MDSSDLLFWAPSWKSQIIDDVLRHSEGIFIDVGANIGETLVDYCASSHGKGYVGFEPNPLCAARTQEIIRSSLLKNCTLVPAALARRGGVIPLYIHSGINADPEATVVENLRPVRCMYLLTALTR
jgi:hypothetical protein